MNATDGEITARYAALFDVVAENGAVVKKAKIATVAITDGYTTLDDIPQMLGIIHGVGVDREARTASIRVRALTPVTVA